MSAYDLIIFSANAATASVARGFMEGAFMVDDFHQVSEYIRASKDVLDILKTLGGLLPKGEKADAAKERLDQAEKALRASEAELAKALGYNLCQCTFPPQIMLSKGRHATHDQEIFECPRCSKQEPSARHFEALDRLKAQNESRSGGSWTASRRR